MTPSFNQPPRKGVNKMTRIRSQDIDQLRIDNAAWANAFVQSIGHFELMKMDAGDTVFAHRLRDLGHTPESAAFRTVTRMEALAKIAR